MRRIDLTDVAFCLVARFSTISRLENAVAVCEFLTENFHTNVYLWEFDEHSNHFAERIIPDSVHYKFHSTISSNRVIMGVGITGNKQK